MTCSDANLVEAVLSGDRSAYADLYDRYARLIRAVCYDATRDLNHSQDLSQEVFLRAYRKLGDLRDADKFAGWLVGIARTVGREWQRRRLRDRHQYVGASPEAMDCAGTSRDEERIVNLREALQSLPERERLALHVFYLQGESAEAVQRVLELSRSGTYRLLERARQRLKKLLRENVS
ncbi:MAG: RNA polymerase sigma factor [Planctomycetota bacterium]